VMNLKVTISFYRRGEGIYGEYTLLNVSIHIWQILKFGRIIEDN